MTPPLLTLLIATDRAASSTNGGKGKRGVWFNVLIWCSLSIGLF